MLLAEIMNKIKGIDRNTIFYYDRMGYIDPQRVKAGKNERRVYSEWDFEMIKAIWRYHKQGFSPRMAYKKAFKVVEKREEDLRLKLTSVPDFRKIPNVGRGDITFSPTVPEAPEDSADTNAGNHKGQGDLRRLVDEIIKSESLPEGSIREIISLIRGYLRQIPTGKEILIDYAHKGQTELSHVSEIPELMGHKEEIDLSPIVELPLEGSDNLDETGGFFDVTSGNHKSY